MKTTQTRTQTRIKWPLLLAGAALLSAGAVGGALFAARDAGGGMPPRTGANSRDKPSTGHAHGAGAEVSPAPRTRDTVLEVGEGPGIVHGATLHQTLTLRVLNARTGHLVVAFETVHEKLMHFIVVTRDLKHFSHLHPVYRGGGEFTLPIALPLGRGPFKIYADYTPKGGGQEVAQHDLQNAKPPFTTAQLTPAVVGKGGWMTKRVVSGPEGAFTPLGTGASTYQVALMPMPAKIVAGQDVMLHFQVRDAKGRPVTDLEPYLGAMGHCVVLSADSNTYLHSHPMGTAMPGMKHDMAAMTSSGAQPAVQLIHDKSEHAEGEPVSRGPNVIFHTNFLRAGLYKAWGQFNHRGRIITAPFVLRVGGAISAPYSEDSRGE